MTWCPDKRRSRPKRLTLVIAAALTGLTVVLLDPMAVLAASPAPAPQRPTWSIEQTPEPQVVNGNLLAISCTAADDCVGVGSYDDAQATSPLAQIWNGTSWKAVQAANPYGAVLYSVLAGVSCPTRSFCEAVGHTTDTSGVQATLAETWNEKSWTVEQSPEPPTRQQ